MATLDRSLRKLLNQTIYVATPRGTLKNGDVYYGTPTAAICRVEPSQKVTDTSPTGAQTISDFVITTEHVVTKMDHIWLPGVTPHDHESEARRPQKIDELTDEDGSVYVYRVYV